MEAYPELKSEKTVLEAMNLYAKVEDDIALARRNYNTSVVQLNSSVQIFPGKLLTGLSGAYVMGFYEDLEPELIRVTLNDGIHL